MQASRNWGLSWTRPKRPLSSSFTSALVDIEPRLRKVVGYRHLPKLREALKRELTLEEKTSGASKKKVA